MLSQTELQKVNTGRPTAGYHRQSYRILIPIKEKTRERLRLRGILDSYNYFRKRHLP